MDLLNSDVLIRIISYLNVIDSCRLSTSCRRMRHLVREFQEEIVGPDVVTSSSWRNGISYDEDSTSAQYEVVDELEEWLYRRNNKSVGEVMRDALCALRSKPSIAFAFGTHDCARRSEGRPVSQIVSEFLPDDAVSLGSVSSTIHCNIPGRPIETKSDFAVMVWSFPQSRTSSLPFCFPQDSHRRRKSGSFTPACYLKLRPMLSDATPPGASLESDYWKVFFVYACGGHAETDSFIGGLQRLHPRSTIMGGSCDTGYVGKKTMTNGIFGLAMGGDVTVRSVVARGVRSIATENSFVGCREKSSSACPWIASEVTLVENPDMTRSSRATHREWSFRNVSTGGRLISRLSFAEATNSVIQRSRHSILGIKKDGDDYFELYNLEACMEGSDLNIVSEGEYAPWAESMYQNAEIDVFVTDSAILLQEMHSTLSRLRDQTKQERLLGGVMFIPPACKFATGSILCWMSEEQLVREHFPVLPCLGFYGNVLYGPETFAEGQNTLKRVHPALHEVTVVFALFFVPKADLGD